MPIYDYRCTACGHRFELRQSFTDDATANCTECGQPAQRVMHPVGIVFKGSGWHSTDYRSSARSGGTDKTDSSTDTKTESKTETKSETKSETPAASTSSSSSSSDSSSSSSKSD